MRKLLCAVLVVMMMLTLVGCGYSQEELDSAYDKGYDAGYAWGTDIGYDDGYNRGDKHIGYAYATHQACRLGLAKRGCTADD